jgi:hypothetical protein
VSARALALAGLVLACGSASPTPPAPAALADAPASAPASAAPECTLETPLVPGVPGSPGNLLPSAINPNGASELAALMRVMQKDLGEARDTLLAGGPTRPLRSTHARLRCAWPTDPKDRNPTYDAFSQAYLASVESLDAASGDEARAAHDRVIDTCVACHQDTCQGPIPAIEALRFPRPASP